MSGMDALVKEQRKWLGCQFLGVVRRALRREPAEASQFFSLDPSTLYVLQTIPREQLPQLCGTGLPYQFKGLAWHLQSEMAQGPKENPGDLVGWKREAFELCVDHFWMLQSWCHKDLGLAALLGGIRCHSTVQAIAGLHPAALKRLATAMYTQMVFDQSQCVQLALLFADASASADRIAVARAGCRVAGAEA